MMLTRFEAGTRIGAAVLLSAIIQMSAPCPIPALADDPAGAEPSRQIAVPEDDPYGDPFGAGSVVLTQKTELSDPMVRWNRGVFEFNDALYFTLLRPAARGYKFVLPLFVRQAIRNFFSNLQEPVYFVNSIFQKEPDDAQIAFKRFIVNSTAGIGGLFTPVNSRPETSKRTFDQTFAKWGIGPGHYIVWPLAGPSSFLRGSVALVFEEAMDPFNYGERGTGVAAAVAETLNETSFQLGSYEDFKKYAVDPYSSLKDIYEKRIQKKSAE